ncbi:MAG TPA: hypothetical protein VHM24_12975 [Gemmatimonadaceae bacterium]|nr:hypothetical protein [Gemmatimonadaceae bacterium]
MSDNRRAPYWRTCHLVSRLAAAVGILFSPANSHAQKTAQAGVARSATVVTVASAILPGAGQALMHQKRSLAYLAFEAAGVGFYIRELRDGTRARDQYRELSRTVARAQFSPDAPGGSWDYYERMEKFAASGAFDAIPGGAVDPERDAATYNGSVWLLARQTFWRDPEVRPSTSSPEYEAALRFYVERAVSAELRWSWLGAPEAFQRYRSAIASSNSAFKSAEKTAGLVLANHFLSAIDAYVSVHPRVRRFADGSVWLTFSRPVP